MFAILKIELLRGKNIGGVKMKKLVTFLGGYLLFVLSYIVVILVVVLVVFLIVVIFGGLIVLGWNLAGPIGVILTLLMICCFGAYLDYLEKDSFYRTCYPERY